METYASEYKKLNPDQRRAVDAIEGPVLVIAGPGTGKTQLLSMRVANILKQTDSDPRAILCLTFTNKATDNMHSRLVSLIGSDANGVYVRTFHSFAAEIMNRYPQYFWSGARLSVVPDAVQLEIIQQVLRDLPAEHPLSLKFIGQFTLIKDVQESINLAKEAGLTADKLRALITANLAYIDQIEPTLAEIGSLRISSKSLVQVGQLIGSLPSHDIEPLIRPFTSLSTVIKESFKLAKEKADQTGKTAPISSWKRRWVQSVNGKYQMSTERSRNEWWLNIADAYQDYYRQLHKRGYYDYSDMLVEVIGQIEQNPNLRAELQEQFQYVLIDEFQDTNAAQLRLAHLIADHPSSEGSPNLMVVGDDDQSIFKFQGAELSNTIGFTRDYPAAKIIVLTRNYRSSQAILDSADQIIKHASYRLVNVLPGITKDLKSSVETDKQARIIHLNYRSRPEQLSGVSKQVADLFTRGNSVAILARSHSSLRDMAAVLVRDGVPIHYEQSNNIYDKPAVSQLMIILRLIQSIRTGDKLKTNELLSSTLAHPMWHLSPNSLWEFAISCLQTSDWYSGLLSSKNKPLNQIGLFLKNLVELSTSEPAAVIVEYALGLRTNDKISSPIKAFYLDQSGINQEYLETVSAMHLFRTLANEFTGRKEANVIDFVALADLMESNDKVLANTTPFQSGDKYVELLSIHKAKGLEFDAVIIIDALAREWSPSTRGRLPPANLPLRPAADDNDDYVRLMYVAATRARQTLIASSYQFSIKGEDETPSPLIEALPKKVLPAQAGKSLIKTLESTLAWPRLKQGDEKQLLKPWLESYSMSVTHLINFLDVSSGGPEFFFRRNVLRLPVTKTPPASLGSAVHSALQLAQNQVNQDKFKASEVLSQFETALKGEGLPQSEFKRQLTLGKQIFKNLFNNLNYRPTKGDKPEYAIMDISCGRAKINGKLDILSQIDDKILISDYKTGRPLLSLQAKSGDEGIKAWKHRLQLTFYALLAQLDPHLKSANSITAQMLYTQAKNQKEFTKIYVPTADEITELSSLIQKVWDHVMKLDFPDTNQYSPDIDGIKKFISDLLK